MRKFFSYQSFVITLLMMLLLCVIPEVHAQWTLDIGGTVKNKETKKRFEGVTITVKRNGTSWKTLTSPDNGRFDISLEPNAIYMVEFSKPGYVTKRMEFSTKNVPEEDAKYGFEFPMEMTLFEKREGLDVSILDKPIAKVAFDPNTGYMDYDPEYTKSIKKEIERMNKELDELMEKLAAERKAKQEEYDKLISAGDKAYNDEKWAEAKPFYQKAVEIFKDESYPQLQLKEIEFKLNEAAEANKFYLAAIKLGDEAFNNKEWDNAIMQYQKASGYNPEEVYPKNKIKEVRELMANEKKLEADYQAAITNGDKALSIQNYELAKQSYQKASEIKTGEQYPKNKLAEIEKLLADLAAQEAAEKAKEEKYKQLITAADGLLSAKDYKGAKGKYNEALGIKAGEQYPKDKLAEIEKLMADLAAKEAAEKAKGEKYQQLITAADGLLSSKDYEGAKEKYNEALGIKAEEAYPKEKIAEIENLLAELAKQKAEEEAKEKAAAELQAKYDGLIAAADKLMGSKDYEAAKSKYNEAIAVKENEQYPKDKIKEIERILAEIAQKKAEEEAAKMAQAEKDEKYKEAITLADNAFSSENYKQAIIKYNEALAVKPDEQYPKDRIKETEGLMAEIERKKQEALNASLAQKELDEKYKKFITSADQDLSVKQYNQAKSNYEAALGIKPDEQYPKDKIQEIENILAEIAKKEEEDDLAAEAERKKQEYFNALVAQADEAFNNKNYDDAKAKYQQALALIPNSSHPTSRLKEIESILSGLAQEDAAAAAEKELNEKYDGLIKVADAAFSTKDYTTAKEKYKAALAVKPKEVYPQNKINEIEGILADLAKQEEEIQVTNNAQKQKQERYQSFIRQGDASLAAKKYQDAINKYEMALGIMPSETYPKEKIAEINQLLSEIAQKEKEQDALESAEKEKRERYDQLIFEGNRMFKFRKYNEAKSKFSEAGNLYPNEQYPPKKIKEINELLSQPKEEEEITVNTSNGIRATITDDNEKAIEEKMAEYFKNKDAEKLKAFEDEKKSFEEAEEIRITKSVERTDYAYQELAEMEEELVRQHEKGNAYHLQYYEELKKTRAAIEAAEAERIKSAKNNRELAKNDLLAIEAEIVKFRREQEKVSKEKMRVHNTYVDAVTEAKLAMIERGDERRAQNREDIQVLAEETEKNRARSAARAEELALDVQEYKKELSEQEEIRISGQIDRTAQNQKELDQYVIDKKKYQEKHDRYYKMDVAALLAFKKNIDEIEHKRIVEADKRREENDKIKTQHQQEFLRRTAAAQKRSEEDAAELERYRGVLNVQETNRQKKADRRRLEESEELIRYKKSLNVPPPSQEKRYKEFQVKLAEERRLNNELITGLQDLADQKRMRANQGLKDFYIGEKQLSENKELSDKYPDGVTEETIEEGNSVTIRRIKVTGTHVDVYERVFYKWGGSYYYKNGTNITQSLWDKESIE